MTILEEAAATQRWKQLNYHPEIPHYTITEDNMLFKTRLDIILSYCVDWFSTTLYFAKLFGTDYSSVSTVMITLIPPS